VAAVVASVAVLGVGGGVAGYRAVAQAQTGTGGYTAAADPTGAAPDPRQQRALEAAKLKAELEAARAQMEMAKAQVELLARKLAEVEKAARAAEKPAAGGTTATTARAPAPTRQDRIDLLKAQAEVKRAALKAARATREESLRRLKQYEKARNKVRDAVSDNDFAAAQVTVEKYAAEEKQREAELLEAELLLKQALRPADSTTGTPSLEQRVKDLEKKVERLQMELDRMKAEAARRALEKAAERKVGR
jgi:hypothetical protein